MTGSPMKSQNGHSWKGLLGLLLSNLSAQAGLPGASCSGPCVDIGPMSDCQPSKDVLDILGHLKRLCKPMFK